MQNIQSIDLIAIDPTVRNGRPYIAGTTIEVSALAIAKIVHGQSPDEIASEYKLTLAQVYAAFAYYYEHKSDIDASINAQRELAQQLREYVTLQTNKPLRN